MIKWTERAIVDVLKIFGQVKVNTLEVSKWIAISLNKITLEINDATLVVGGDWVVQAEWVKMVTYGDFIQVMDFWVEIEEVETIEMREYNFTKALKESKFSEDKIVLFLHSTVGLNHTSKGVSADRIIK